MTRAFHGALWVVLLFGVVVALQAADDPNWLTNPGFEEGQGSPGGWGLGMEGRGEGEAVWQEGDAHSGDRCLRVKLTTRGDYFMGRQYLAQPVTPGNLYQLHGWYRSDTEGCAHPVVYYKKADGHVFAAWETPLPLAEDWTEFRFTLRPPEGTERFEIQLRNQGIIGTAWFDDVFLGPAAALQAQWDASLAAFEKSLAEGPLSLRALDPSQRPQALELAEPGRWRKLQDSTSVSIFAARNERESFSALVMGLGEGELTAELSDLAGPEGASISAEQARVRWVEYVRTNAGWMPDPLMEQQPFTRPERGAPILWVTVHVPEDAAPGVYSGQLTAKANGQTATLPVSLEVHDFALPATTYLQSSFWVFRHCIRNVYGMEEVPFSFYTKFLDLCLETRLAPIDAAEWHDQPLVQMVRRPNGQLDVDWQPWDEYLQYCMDRGMSAFNVADDHWFGSYFDSFPVRDLKTGKVERVTLERGSDEWRRTVVRFFRLARAHFTEKGWADRAYLQAYDEPGNDEKLQAEINRFHMLAREGWPGLRTLITTPIDFGILGEQIGIWCPLTPHYDVELAAAAREKGQEVWWYVCCGPTAPWANFFLNQSGAAHRVLFWQTFGRKSEGLLYWGINHWPDYAGRTMDPVPSEQRWPQAPWNDGGRNGDGYFLYPGPDGPLTSTRFEVMRDGVEDYDCLRMLEELLETKGESMTPMLRRRAERALVMTPDLYKTMTSYPPDAGEMVARRQEVNELIVRIGGR